MRFYEFEAKALLRKAGVPTSSGGPATRADEAARIAGEVAGDVVLKSQVLTGGRMKAGGIQFASTPDEARAAVTEENSKGITLVKIWVDDRNGQFPKLTPELYGAVIEAAHANRQKVAAHIFALSDAKGLMRAGIDAFAHSVRDTDIDEEGMTLFRERPDLVLIPNLPNRGVATDLSWLSGTVPAAELAEMQAGAVDNPQQQQGFAVQGRNLAKLNQAGTKIAMGTDGSVPWAAHTGLPSLVTSTRTTAARFPSEMTEDSARSVPCLTAVR